MKIEIKDDMQNWQKIDMFMILIGPPYVFIAKNSLTSGLTSIAWSVL